jgi:hypothetical protein
VENKSEIFELRGRLSALGWETIKDWALAHNRNPNTVVKVINRHWCSGTNPSGDTSNRILSDLKKTLREEIKNKNRRKLK